MLQLPNGCTCSEPAVYPSNWNSAGGSVKDTWYIQFYFQDPLFKEKYPRGKCCQIKAGLNKIKSLPERRTAAKTFLAELRHLLVNMGYNPILGRNTVETEVNEYEIDPNTPFLDALEQAFKRLSCSKNTTDAIRQLLVHFGKSVKQLRYASLPIKDVRKRHIRLSIENVARVKDYWSSYQFNHYRSHLGMLFAELVELEVIDFNFCLAIRKAKTLKKLTRSLTKDERSTIDKFLRENYYEQWRYMQIFFHGGTRTTELLRVKGEDVFLDRQEFKALIKKGRAWIEVLKPIKDIALPFWQELMKNCSPGDYIFSEGLKPGPTSIDPKQISKRWRKHVKEKLGIDVNFNNLRHINTTEVVDDIYGKLIKDAQEKAAQLNGHADTSMVVNVYDLRNKTRKDEHIKSAKNSFA